MICPACKNPMIVVEYHQVELDYCGSCQGIWFDSGELGLLLEKAGIDHPATFIDAMLKAPEAAMDEKRRRCPICRRKMKKASISQTGHVLVDACTSQDGIWFDGGEVDHLVQFLSARPGVQPHEDEVFNFIKEVFKK